MAAFIGSVGGNQSLLAQARGYHESLYDGFYDFGGRIDVRAVVGTGLETVRSVDITHGPQGGFAVTGRFGNGDSTVPGLSAAQGPVGTTTPLGDPVHLQYTCNISHVPLPGNGVVLEAYDDFLDFARVPRKLEPRPCSAGGGSFWFDAGVVGLSRSRSRGASGHADRPRAGRPRRPDRPDRRATVGRRGHGRRPAGDVTTQVANATFTYTPLADDKRRDDADLRPGDRDAGAGARAAGRRAAVTIDGATVEPTHRPPDPAPARPSPSPRRRRPLAAPTAKKLRLVGKPKLKGRKLTLKVFVPGAGAEGDAANAGARPREGEPKAAGTRKLTISFKRRPPRKVSLKVTFKPHRRELQSEADRQAARSSIQLGELLGQLPAPPPRG